MTDKTITLRSDLVERLETLAQAEGRTLDEVLGELLEHHAPERTRGNWALAVAEAMEAAHIEWRDDPDASENSGEYFQQYLREKWEQAQSSDAD